jgi:hypothetical protein
VLLAIGLDPLSPAATGADVNEYVAASIAAGRLYTAAASVVASARHMCARAHP